MRLVPGPAGQLLCSEERQALFLYVQLLVARNLCALPILALGVWAETPRPALMVLEFQLSSTEIERVDLTVGAFQ